MTPPQSLQTGPRARPDPGTGAAADGVEPLLPPGTPWHRRPPEIPPALGRLCDTRDRLEREREARYHARIEAADAALAEGLQRVEAARTSALDEARSRHGSARKAAENAHQAEEAEARGHDAKTRAALKARARKVMEEAREAKESAGWEAGTLFEAGEKGERERHEQYGKDLAAEVEGFEVLRAEAEMRLAAYRKYGARSEPAAETDPPQREGEEPLDAFRRAIAEADAQLAAIEKLKLPQALMGGNVVWPFLLPPLALAWPAIVAFGPLYGTIAAVVVGVAIGFGLRVWLYGFARRSLDGLQPPLLATLARAEALIPVSRAWGEEAHRRIARENRERRDSELRRADEQFASARADVEAHYNEGIRRTEEETGSRLAAAAAARDRKLAEADAKLGSRESEAESAHASESGRLRDEHARHHAEAEARRGRDWEELSVRWASGLAEIGGAVDEVNAESDRRFPDWDDPASPLWTRAAEVPPAVRFGEVRIDLAAFPHGQPRDERLRAMAPASFELPALLTLPDRGSLLIESGSEGREEAMRLLRGAMTRWLTGLPPGRVRFTLLDPVGLGRNFAAFMHLADYSELLVNSRIWTEPQQIEQRLADLSLHMENVIQQYLRNEYATLEEYNAQAGEVAEPYRVLVVADFPANFHEQSAQRLLSIVQSGAKCGVYTMIAVDTDQSLPGNVRLEDLEAHAATLRREKGRFVWKDEALGAFPIALDGPPDPERFTRLLHETGEAARHANRVEVPFEVVAPPAEKWWQGDTRAGVDIPLGRSGATKLQHLKLGKGTSQHVLIAGRTGSGKSTLLHALITNAALMYSPDQVELYLIDFKKGVEFKTYAQHELPHARVVAIESEREFGLSVLQRLDEELKRRGDIFRDRSVQDLNGYRGLPDAPPLPRILLIVDEFQEFFVEDDKTAQEAALLLDRLVRQGRAFGVHVHLGSQTLSGAYSLARSTLGQMGVRVALQCPEADAHLILSEDNPAARLLTRPGEAIYNDANGMVEGNHVFQVVWLPDDRREGYLKRIKELARGRGQEMPRPQIVFEGNVAADIRRNHLLRALLESPAPPGPSKASAAWLGEAVAIKDPTAAVFRRMGGNHLLVVGQDPEAARGIFAASVLGLAAQHRPDSARFYLLDGTPEDDPMAGWLGRVAEGLPHPVRVGSFRDVGPIFEELAGDLARRQEGEANAPSTFLFVFDASRFRDLRKQEDDYSFSFGKSDAPKPISASGVFADLLREGPGLGMHAIAWFDSLNNLNRTLDRQGLREFEMRVLFQMSANDSSNLIDSPLANRLGPNRGLFVSEDQGTLEKFRPYGPPDPEWLDDLKRRLAERSAEAPGG